MACSTSLRCRKPARVAALQSSSPAERFFELAKSSSMYCCTGEDETRCALQLYGVAELLVADGAVGWHALAAEYKADIHIVKATTADGKRFCRGVRVAALLHRPIDADTFDAVVHDAVYRASPIDSSKIVSDAIEYSPAHDSSTIVVVEQQMSSSVRGRFLSWCTLALRKEIPDRGVGDVEALVCCIEVLLDCLEAQGLHSDSIAETLQAAAQMLADEGAPDCAAEFAANWYDIIMP